jgi:hypothetical protein
MCNAGRFHNVLDRYPVARVMAMSQELAVDADGDGLLCISIEAFRAPERLLAFKMILAPPRAFSGAIQCATCLESECSGVSVMAAGFASSSAYVRAGAVRGDFI